MALNLIKRVGPDTIRKLERAAARRFAEAALLESIEPLGAIYLLGYTIEIRMKAAHYRMAGLTIDQDINSPQPPNNVSARKLAERQIRSMPGFPPHATVGHHLLGWAQLVIASRSTAGLPQLSAQQAFLRHISDASLCWAEFLRYHANRPYNAEMTAVRDAARWMKSHYRKLWS